MMDKIRNKVLVIVGPTASGKSALALEIARRVPAEIISADSRQIFRHLNVGTAKPSPLELSEIVHHCIDIRDPNERFTAGDFQLIGRNNIDDIHRKSKLPIVCGGTGLYIRGVIDGFFEQPEFSGEHRAKLESRLVKEGKEWLFRELQRIDPVAASTMDATKYRRVIRALEVFYETGCTISQFHAGHQRDAMYDAEWVGLEWDRKILYGRIDARVDAMIRNGFLDEVKTLVSLGFDDRYQSMQTVGYKEALQFLQNEISHERMIELMKQNTRRFAKRQMTWFRKEDRIVWHPVSSDNEISLIAGNLARTIHL
jgi:tRNA dimethylallyltransferase